MSTYQDRKVTVKFTQEQYEFAVRLAPRLCKSIFGGKTVSALLRQLLNDCIKEYGCLVNLNDDQGAAMAKNFSEKKGVKS